MGAQRRPVEADELQQEAVEAGGTPDRRAATVGQQVASAGTLRTVTLRPRGGVPALEAELYDGSGMIKLVWLGRRRIGGVEPGPRDRRPTAGSTDQRGVLTLYNPRYELP